MVDQHHRASSTPRPRRLLAMAAIVSTAVVLPFASPAAAVSFSNSAPIEIGTPVMGELYTAANLYPSNISVSGFTGAATDVNVTLCGFSARFPSDVNVLLVAPNGANALIMSDVGGNGGSEGSDPEPAGWDVAVTNINLTLDDAAPSPLPADSALSTGTWRPVDDDTGEFPLAGFPDADTFPGPAPEPSANVALSTFNGVNPNGTWSLYVVDDFPGLADVGETQLPKFSCGWSIDVTAAGGGGSADKPPADFDGNGTTDISVFRPATGSWFVRNGTSAAWGTSGDIPVPADYDGNGTADIAVFRPSSGTWFVQNGIAAAWGTSGDIPVPGDYDGNGSADIAVFRPSSGTWFVRNGSHRGLGHRRRHPRARPTTTATAPPTSPCSGRRTGLVRAQRHDGGVGHHRRHPRSRRLRRQRQRRHRGVPSLQRHLVRAQRRGRGVGHGGRHPGSRRLRRQWHHRHGDLPPR